MRARAGAGLALVPLLAWACAVDVAGRKPGRDEAADLSEQGLKLAARHAEERAALSGRRVRAPELNAYIERVNCRVTGRYCAEIRPYTMRVPGFNASMAPNGFEQVWTGLLLRVENEAQLAAVLGHEAAHYVQRHTLERFETTRRTANVLLATQLALTAGGAGTASAESVEIDLGAVGELVARGFLAAYSREQEVEADRRGFEMMVDAGYAPAEAAAVWRNLVAERDACDLPTPPALFASHPPSEERLGALVRLAERTGAGGETRSAAFRDATRAHRGDWLRMELTRGHLCRTRVLLERLIEHGRGLGELHYYRGELYRRRGREGDLDRAIGAYRQALAHPAAPAVTRRALGFALWDAGRPAEAAEALRAYLREADTPGDAAMIRSYLERLP